MMIAFRVDETIQIWTVHFIRCLTLVDKLKKQGVLINFISRNLLAHLSEMLVAKGMEYMPLISHAVQEPNDELGHSDWIG